MDQQTLSDLIVSDDFGGVTLDWLQVFRSALGYNYEGYLMKKEYIIKAIYVIILILL